MNWINVYSETGQPVARLPETLNPVKCGYTLPNSFNHWFKTELGVDISSGHVTHPTSAGFAYGYRGSAQEIRKSFNRTLKSGKLDQIVNWMPLECGGTIFVAPTDGLREAGKAANKKRTSGLKRGLYG